MSNSRASAIRTTILIEDLEEFKAFLIAKGFVNFSVSPIRSGAHLTVVFDNPAEVMKYKLQGVENEYKNARSHVYFYDLDDAWGSDQAKDIFGGDDY